LAKLEVTRI